MTSDNIIDWLFPTRWELSVFLISFHKLQNLLYFCDSQDWDTFVCVRKNIRHSYRQQESWSRHLSIKASATARKHLWFVPCTVICSFCVRNLRGSRKTSYCKSLSLFPYFCRVFLGFDENSGICSCRRGSCWLRYVNTGSWTWLAEPGCVLGIEKGGLRMRLRRYLVIKRWRLSFRHQFRSMNWITIYQILVEYTCKSLLIIFKGWTGFQQYAL